MTPRRGKSLLTGDRCRDVPAAATSDGGLPRVLQAPRPAYSGPTLDYAGGARSDHRAARRVTRAARRGPAPRVGAPSGATPRIPAGAARGRLLDAALRHHDDVARVGAEEAPLGGHAARHLDDAESDGVKQLTELVQAEGADRDPLLELPAVVEHHRAVRLDA